MFSEFSSDTVLRTPGAPPLAFVWAPPSLASCRKRKGPLFGLRPVVRLGSRRVGLGACGPWVVGLPWVVGA